MSKATRFSADAVDAAATVRSTSATAASPKRRIPQSLPRQSAAYLITLCAPSATSPQGSIYRVTRPSAFSAMLPQVQATTVGECQCLCNKRPAHGETYSTTHLMPTPTTWSLRYQERRSMNCHRQTLPRRRIDIAHRASGNWCTQPAGSPGPLWGHFPLWRVGLLSGQSSLRIKALWNVSDPRRHRLDARRHTAAKFADGLLTHR